MEQETGISLRQGRYPSLLTNRCHLAWQVMHKVEPCARAAGQSGVGTANSGTNALARSAKLTRPWQLVQLAVPGRESSQRAVAEDDRHGGRPCRQTGKARARSKATAAMQVISDATVNRRRFTFDVIGTLRRLTKKLSGPARRDEPHFSKDRRDGSVSSASAIVPHRSSVPRPASSRDSGYCHELS
jgi:hypothetical protein